MPFVNPFASPLNAQLQEKQFSVNVEEMNFTVRKIWLERIGQFDLIS